MTTRRNLLRAAAAVPVLALSGAAPVPVAESTARWLSPAGWAPQPVEPGPDVQIRICCLGDSRTQGAGDTSPVNGSPDWNGYRKPLLANLQGPQELHGAVMVGSQVNGSANIHHEGHSGATIGELTALVQGGILANPAPTSNGPPHIVIVQAGANDAGKGRTADQMLDDMAGLLNAVLAVGDLRIVLCEEIRESGSVSHLLTAGGFVQDEYNDGLPAMIQAVDPTRISLVRTGDLEQADLFDGIHPNHRGYNRWAALLFAGGMAPWLGRKQKYMANIDWPYERIPRERLSPR